jgi:hypothetical protein
MEFFPAADEEQFEIIKKVIDLTDYYVLIIGKRYGSIESKSGISFTELEYNYALSKQIPVLVFMLNYGDDSDESFEHQQKLEDFRKRVSDTRTVSMCNSIEDFISNFGSSIMNSIINNKRPGWYRGTEFEYSPSLMRFNSENDEESFQDDFEFDILSPFQQLLIRLAIDKKFDYYSFSQTNLVNMDDLLNLIYSDKISMHNLKLKKIDILKLWELIDDAFDIFNYHDFGFKKINDGDILMNDLGAYIDKEHEYYFDIDELFKKLEVNFGIDIDIDPRDTSCVSTDQDEEELINFEIREQVKKILKNKTAYLFK